VQRAKGGHPLHERVVGRVDAERAVRVVDGAGIVKGSVIAGEPGALDGGTTPGPIETEGDYYATALQVGGQVVAQCHRVGVRAVGEGDDNVVLLELGERRCACTAIEVIHKFDPWQSKQIVANSVGDGVTVGGDYQNAVVAVGITRRSRSDGG
jgi:hypothetical protein